MEIQPESSPSIDENELLALLLQDELTPTHLNTAIPRGNDSRSELSFGQQLLWAIEQMYDNSAAYNIPYSILFKGQLSVNALSKSMQAIVERHSILRSVQRVENGRPYQLITSSSFDLPCHDARSLPQPQRDAHVQELGRRDAQQAFDLQHGPLLRASLIQLEDDAWLLYLTFHHSIFDGWSEHIFFQELEHFYRAYHTIPSSEGTPATLSIPSYPSSSLPPLPIQYTDYAHWQYQQYTQGAYRPQQDYWVAHLHDAPLSTDLPTDTSLSITSLLPTLAGERVPITLSPSLTHALKRLARQEHCSLFMVLLAAWFCLLYRYSGQNDLVVGTLIAKRSQPEVEALIGYFIHPLAIRIQVQGDFRTVLRQVQSVTLQAYENGEIPFEDAFRQAHASATTPARTPQLQTAVVLQNTPVHALQLPAVEVSWQWRYTHTAKFPLLLDLAESEDGLSGKIEYSSELFSQQRIQRLAHHLTTLLHAIIADPQQPVEYLPLLTRQERQQLLVTWNGTQTDYPTLPSSIQEGFEQQVARTPDTNILFYGQQALTYRQLNTRANQLAHYLQHCGVGKETPVGVFLPRSFEQIICLLAITKAGGAYVPLDPTYPRERIAFMLENCAAPFVLSLSSLPYAFPTASEPDSLPPYRVLYLDDVAEQIAQQPTTNPVSHAQSDGLLYILYTSGSTGKPKGVMGTQRATLNRLAWMWQTYPFTAQDVCCQKTSLNFVDAAWEIWGPLLQGVPLVLIADETIREPARFLDTLHEHHVTRIVLVPSFLRALLEASENMQQAVPDLKLCISSGEALSPQLAQQFFSQCLDCVLLNLYGSSEVAADVTAYEVRPQDTLSCIPLGRPIANTRVYVLDAHLQPVPIGLPGEICIGGLGLARGYLGLDQLTHERFLSNPFDPSAHSRLFRTGDRGFLDEDGLLHYLGRIDNQVKIHGIRVELGEIEAVLLAHPAIEQCVVTGDARGKLSAYLVCNTSIQHADLRGYLSQHLPSYMIPNVLNILDELPLTSNGKIDRQRLPGLSATSIAPTSYAPARSEVERQLVSIWEHALGITPIGIYDRFDEAGGDSLLLLQVINQQYNLFKVRIPVRDFLAHPTIEAVAHWIDTRLSQLFDPQLEALLASLEQEDQPSQA